MDCVRPNDGHTVRRRVNVGKRLCGIEEGSSLNYVAIHFTLRRVRREAKVNYFLTSIRDAYSSALHSSRTTISIVAFMASHRLTQLPSRTHTSLASKSRPDPFTPVSPLVNSLQSSLLKNARFRPPSCNRDRQVLLLTPFQKSSPNNCALVFPGNQQLGENWSRKLGGDLV